MNDHEFDRMFRDRLYAQSYRPRQQVWKQLRLRWRERIAARQWRWFSSAAVVVVVGVVAVTSARGIKDARSQANAVAGTGAAASASTRAVVSAAGQRAPGMSPVASGMSPGASGTAPAVSGAAPGGAAIASAAVANTHGTGREGSLMARRGEAGRAGYAGRHGGTRGRQGADGSKRGGQGEDWEHAAGAGISGGDDSRVVTQWGDDSRVAAEAAGRGLRVAGHQTVGHQTVGSQMTNLEEAVVGRNGERMGVVLPQRAQLASRAGVQLPARAKAARISLPERQKKDADPAWNGWSGEVYGSPDFPTSQFNFSWTAGFRVSRIFAAHYSITTGLQYSTVNMRRGDWAMLVQYPPRFNNVDLPVLLGYSTGGQRVRLSAYAGGIFNLYSHAAGNPGFPWPSHTAPSLYLGLDLAYRLNERWALFVQPYGRSLFGSGSKSLLQGGTKTEGAMLGIRYRFNP